LQGEKEDPLWNTGKEFGRKVLVLNILSLKVHEKKTASQ
jgi:hypothetical protein